MLELILPD